MNSITQTNPIPVAVVGCGRMGRLHARVFSEMPQVKLVGCFDSDPDAAQSACDDYGGEVFTSIDAIADSVKAVTVAVPTNCHAATAVPLLKRGIACLIEKPLAQNTDEAKLIAETARKHHAVVQVGHIERFNPAVRAMQRLEIVPHFIEVTRISPLTFRSIDVGVVLDMMIHDIDIVLMLARSKVVSIDAVGVGVIGGGTAGNAVEDICNARLRFENGCVANLTASRLALKTERRMRVFSADAYVSLDYQKRYGLVARRSPNVGAIRNMVQKIRDGEIEDLSQLNFKEVVNFEELQIDDVEPLRAELEAFVDACNGVRPPPVTAEDGLAAVDLAERIVRSIGPMANALA